MLIAPAKRNVGFDSLMPADGTHRSSLHPNGDFGISRLRATA
jgi:hypothetical protein